MSVMCRITLGIRVIGGLHCMLVSAVHGLLGSLRKPRPIPALRLETAKL